MHVSCLHPSQYPCEGRRQALLSRLSKLFCCVVVRVPVRLLERAGSRCAAGLRLPHPPAFTRVQGTHMHVPEMTYAHSAASCQCSSRRPPGFSSMSAPAMVVAVRVAFVLAL